ncbi:molybdenum cofactor biosynthesis protein MoaE [Sphingomonas astaxanthinifaciens]|nr:molybdenum cofactor biosynthesis protein MoaE [Sphingomonas astaxanthinifaciens]
MRAILSEESLDPASLLAGFTARLPGTVGAVMSFLGLARANGSAGEVLDALVLEAHPTATLRSLDAIAADAVARFNLLAVEVVHRHGRIAPAEPIVWVAAAAAHRRAAFEACDQIMDRLKTEAVLWKREEGEQGRRWIEPTTADHEAAARWSTK